MHVSRRQALSSLGSCLALGALAHPALAGASGLLSPRSPASPGAREAAGFLGAVRRGELERVRHMLAVEPGLARSVAEDGRSAFVLAHVHGHEQVAAALLAAGLELDIVEAVLAEDWERFEALAEARPALLGHAHPIGGTPLYAAALVGSRGCWRLRALGCESDARPAGGSGFTPARGALEAALPTWARIGLTDVCSNGGDVNAPQAGGSSVLHAAVARRDELLVRLAIRKGADVEATDAAGRTAADLAAELEWEAGVTLLAQHAQLPRDNRSSRFALDSNREPIVRPDLSDVQRELQSEVTGSSHFNLPRVRELVEADARLVFSISGDDELAIEACAHTSAGDIIRYHLDHGAPLSLPTAVSLGDLESISFWLERDPSLVHERGAHDFPLMWYAAHNGSLEVAELLVHHGVEVDQESMGSTALHICASRGRTEFASWLLERGANPEAVGYARDRAGETPMQVAAAGGESQLAEMLRYAEK